MLYSSNRDVAGYQAIFNAGHFVQRSPSETSADAWRPAQGSQSQDRQHSLRIAPSCLRFYKNARALITEAQLRVLKDEGHPPWDPLKTAVFSGPAKAPTLWGMHSHCTPKESQPHACCYRCEGLMSGQRGPCQEHNGAQMLTLLRHKATEAAVLTLLGWTRSAANAMASSAHPSYCSLLETPPSSQTPAQGGVE